MATPNDDLVAAILAVADNKTLDVQTHYKPTETFQYTHFSWSHPLNVKKDFIKGETLRSLRTNSVKENWRPSVCRQTTDRFCPEHRQPVGRWLRGFQPEQTSIIGGVSFVSKSLLGIREQKELKLNCKWILSWKPRSHVRIWGYRTWPLVSFLRGKRQTKQEV